MIKVSKCMVASAILAVLLATSLYGCYTFIRMPSTRSKNNVDLRYSQSAEYGYTALVEPSLLYDNRTEIGEGEPLYTNLVEQIEIVLKYELTQMPSPVEMSGIEIKYEASVTLSGGDWKKTYPLNSMTSKVSSFTETYTIDMEEIEGIVETIGEETGARAHSYTYEIKSSINLEASAGRETIEQAFNPTLTVKFEGGTIEFEELSSAKSGSVIHHEEELATWRLLGFAVEVPAMRLISIITSISIIALLYNPLTLALQERTSRSFMERLSGDIRDRIVEISEPPERIERATIKVSSLEDLARIAEEAFKPIMHHGELFYVLDGDVRYEYQVEAEPDARASAFLNCILSSMFLTIQT